MNVARARITWPACLLAFDGFALQEAQPTNAASGPARDSSNAADEKAGAGTARGSNERGQGGGKAQNGQGAEWGKTKGKVYRGQSASRGGAL